MVYKDYWALTQWIRYYSSQLGIENLYIVVHGQDEKVNKIAKGANIWAIPRETLVGFDKRRNKMLNDFQSGLLEFYDWVIRTDTDELICVDPIKYGTLSDFFSTVEEDAVFSIGLNLFEQPSEDEIQPDMPLFDSRSAVVVTGNYSKAWAVRRNAPLMRHGVKLTNGDDTQFTYAFPEGVFLVHLKFASIAALAAANATRKQVAGSGVPGAPGWGWRRADAHAMRFFEKAEGLKEQSWDDALELAYKLIPTSMNYSESDGVIRSPGIPFLTKTTLPDWFKSL